MVKQDKFIDIYTSSKPDVLRALFNLNLRKLWGAISLDCYRNLVNATKIIALIQYIALILEFVTKIISQDICYIFAIYKFKILIQLTF